MCVYLNLPTKKNNPIQFSKMNMPTRLGRLTHKVSADISGIIATGEKFAKCYNEPLIQFTCIELSLVLFSGFNGYIGSVNSILFSFAVSAAEPMFFFLFRLFRAQTTS